MLAKKEIKELLDTITNPNKSDFVMGMMEENVCLEDDGRIRTIVPLYGVDSEHLEIERNTDSRILSVYVYDDNAHSITQLDTAEIMSGATKDKINEFFDKEEKVLTDIAKEMYERIHGKVEALQQANESHEERE